MATVSSLGVGSGLDLQALVDGLVTSERQVRLGSLATREAITTEKISAYGLLKSAVSLFDGSLSSLSNISTFQARSITSSDEDAFTVSVSADAGLGSYAIEVIEAGESQTLTGSGLVDVTNVAVSNANTPIGGGTLTIQQGSQTAFTVEVAPSASTLNDIVNAINNAEKNSGVEATIINSDSGPVLVINAVDVGSANEITISVDDIDNDDTNPIGLSQLTFDPSDLPGSNLAQLNAALDAQITVNGLTVTSDSGQTFADIIDGVTITALTETAQVGTFTIGQDTSQATTAVNAFIKSFNALVDSVDKLGRGGTDGGEASGILVGDSVLRTLTTQLRRTIFSAVSQSQPLGVRTLSDIGLQLDRDGLITLDEDTFSGLLESNFDDVARLLASDGNAVAQNQQLQSVEFDTVTSVVGEGQLEITVGEDSFAIDISSGLGNDTVQGIRDAINNATNNTGVIATVILVDDGAGGTNAQLLLSSENAGTSGEISISVTDIDTNNTDLLGLSQLVTENFTEVTSASIDTQKGIIVSLQSVIKGFLGGRGETGIIDARTEGLNTDIKRIADERIQQELRIDAFEARLARQFASLDLLVANLQSSGDFLLSQLDTISQISTNRNNK